MTNGDDESTRSGGISDCTALHDAALHCTAALLLEPMRLKAKTKNEISTQASKNDAPLH